MPSKYKSMSRQHQKLIYALLKEYANHLSSKNPVVALSDYWMYKAKQDMKKLYKKATKDIREEDPIKEFKNNINDTLDNILDRDLKLETKKEIITEDILCNLRYFIEDLALQLGDTETFSLSLRLCSSEKAIRFTQFLIDYFLDNEIEISEKTIKMIQNQEHDKYIYVMLKNKKCAICYKDNADLDHYDSVSSIGGYKQDTGLKTRFISLCREHHTIKHQLETIQFERKYGLKGIFLKEEQVKELKKIYSNHFKAFNK